MEKSHLSFRLPKHLVEALRKDAAEDDRSMANVLTRILREWYGDGSDEERKRRVFGRVLDDLDDLEDPFTDADPPLEQHTPEQSWTGTLGPGLRRKDP